MKDYQIDGIEEDQLVLNNSSWDVKVSLDEVEMILKPPPGPSPFGQILGGAIGGYGGICVGFIVGSIAFGGLKNEEGVGAVIIVSLFGGAYYGSKVGGNFLKRDPEIIVDMTMWTVDEKKEFIQTNLIY